VEFSGLEFDAVLRWVEVFGVEGEFWVPSNNPK
jgi:hypothetical protein